MVVEALVLTGCAIVFTIVGFIAGNTHGYDRGREEAKEQDER